MNVKKLVVGALIGGLVFFFLGYLFYGVLFPNIYPQTGQENMSFVFLGCMTFGVLLSYLFVKMGVPDCKKGILSGTVIGFLLGLYSNFFMYSRANVNYSNMFLDVFVMTVMGAITGFFIGFTFKRMNL